ncbi:uncharacterized protein Dere_GG26290 [Drosophila erecta]|uniref:Secreted protein n=1 Tax=Drosophila erecta TaxID=7220 RepID=A0A0Q5RNL8_DROER|nr:uncharacterized protein Dere_GG26290 [Drosophila erecta]
MILRLILVMAESAFRVSSLQETVARMLRRVEQSPLCDLGVPLAGSCRQDATTDRAEPSKQILRIVSWVHPLQEAVNRS